ncbi:MAG TPA: hypothetical protein VGK73_12615 [Polyangiaceae bacterium]
MNDLADEVLANAAFERVKGELLRIPAESLLQVSLDISAAVATVLGVVPEVRGLREQVRKELPSFDIERFDKLEDYALALSYAQASYLSATQGSDELEPVAAEAAKVRERLLAEAKSLVHHGVVSQSQLSQLKGANGYKNVATDVMVLANLLQTVFPQIEGKSMTTMADLERASRVATRLLRIVGLKEQGPAQIAETTDLRLRAYTTLFLAYEDVRRAVTYLRGAKDDADTITPSLHPGRPRPKKGSIPESPPVEGGGRTTSPDATAPGTGSVPANLAAASAQPQASASPAGSKGPFLS